MNCLNRKQNQCHNKQQTTSPCPGDSKAGKIFLLPVNKLKYQLFFTGPALFRPPPLGNSSRPATRLDSVKKLPVPVSLLPSLGRALSVIFSIIFCRKHLPEPALALSAGWTATCRQPFWAAAIKRSAFSFSIQYPPCFFHFPVKLPEALTDNYSEENTKDDPGDPIRSLGVDRQSGFDHIYGRDTGYHYHPVQRG